MSPISGWEPSELDKQTQIAQQALARIVELEAMGTSESARLSKLLVGTRAELAALKARRCTSCKDEAECTALTAVCEYSDWEIEDSYQFGCCLHSDDRAERGPS